MGDDNESYRAGLKSGRNDKGLSRFLKDTVNSDPSYQKGVRHGIRDESKSINHYSSDSSSTGGSGSGFRLSSIPGTAIGLVFLFYLLWAGSKILGYGEKMDAADFFIAAPGMFLIILVMIYCAASFLGIFLVVGASIMFLSYIFSSDEPTDLTASCINRVAYPYPAEGGGNIHCMGQTIQKFYPSNSYPVISVRDASGKRPSRDYKVYVGRNYCDKQYVNWTNIVAEYDVLACILRDEKGGSVWNMGPNALPRFARRNAAGLILDIK